MTSVLDPAQPQTLEDEEAPGLFRGIVVCLVPGLVLWLVIIWCVTELLNGFS